MIPSLPQRLRAAAAALPGARVSMRQLASAQGTAAQGSMLMMLAVPCMLPVAGVGTVLGWGLVAVAFAMWRGQRLGGLPGRVGAFELPRPWALKVLGLMATIYALAGRVSRTRLTHLADHGQGRWMAAKVALMAVLIILPIPLGNLLPALSLVLLALGLAFRDGVAVMLAAVTALLALAYTAALGWLVWAWGLDPVMAWFGL